MNPPLSYTPAYLGLLAAQILAVTSNAFLDIQYGVFGTEVLLWSIAFAAALWIGWLQKGEGSEEGKQWMRRTLVFGALLTVVVFMPMWGFPRAGLYMLAMLQVSYNCVTTTRRHLHLSLLISLVMVLFATSHYRADWTMLFYLVPFVVAVVFTLVAEQVNRKALELRQQSIGHQVVGAQGAAIAAATAVILALGLLFYALTPQVTWLSLSWMWGQTSAVTQGNGNLQTGNGGNQPAEGGGSGGGGGYGQGGGGGSASAGWSSAGEMRQAAARQGMPEWQRDAINGMADLAESMGKVMSPVMQSLNQLWQDFKSWLKQNSESILTSLFILAVLALLYAIWRLMREAMLVTWLRTRYDYVRLVLLPMHSSNEYAAKYFYEAMARLFDLQEIERTPNSNTREYLADINLFFHHLSRETGEMTRIYEDMRYGNGSKAPPLEYMRELYKTVFRQLD